MSTAAPKCRILVVDDEPGVCDAMSMILAFDGHEVETAPNGEKALEALDQRGFELVITDYSMPNMKGDRLAAAIKERNRDLPVIMISAYAEMLLASGDTPFEHIDHLLGKPFQIGKLREAIATTISKMRPAQETTAPE